MGDQNLQLVGNVSDVDTRQVQNTKLRVLRQLLGCYAVSIQLRVLEKALEVFQSENNDRGVSVLTSVLYKSLFKEAGNTPESEEMVSLLRHAKDYWFPKTLNCLQDE